MLAFERRSSADGDGTGIYMENDLVALKSSDDILDDPETKSTVMAQRLDHDSIPNWLIMAKPKAPFIQHWMLEYVNAHEEDGFQKLALITASQLAMERSDITILDGHAWFYPLASNTDGDLTLKKLWLGKSWVDIEESYGTHIWHWNELYRHALTPHTVQVIDTPLFCKVRPLFDILRNSKKQSGKRSGKQDCIISDVGELDAADYRLFSDYRSDKDIEDIKWLDSSGYSNHGWAPKGTMLRLNKAGQLAREFDGGSYAILPVPTGWDARAWTVRMKLRIHPRSLNSFNGFGLFKIRAENEGDITIGLMRRRQPVSSLMLKLDWNQKSGQANQYGLHPMDEDSERYFPLEDFKPLEDAYHELAVTYDGLRKGTASIYLDGTKLGSQWIRKKNATCIGQDVWVNARDWQELDIGFRGSMRRFTMYADALPREALAIPIPETPRMRSLYSEEPTLEVLSIKIFMILFFFLFMFLAIFRRRKILYKTLPFRFRRILREHRRHISEHKVLYTE